MIQKNIREYNNETYSIEEGAELIKELDDRTKHGENGYNSIAELADKVKKSGQRQPAVLSKASIDLAPPTENEGDRYLLYGSGTPNAGWDDQPTNTLVEFNGTSWVAETPKVGQTVYVINTDSNLQYKTTPSNGWYPYVDEGGAGDMLKSLYDPAGKEEQVLTVSDILDEDDMASDSETKTASQQSIKAFVLNKVASTVKLQGGYNASTNTPNLTTPFGVKYGDQYIVTVAGTFFGANVEVGDSLISLADDPSTLANWMLLQTNLDAASVKTLNESNPDTNALTDAALAKLNRTNNVLVNATANGTINLAIETYDGFVLTPTGDISLNQVLGSLTDATYTVTINPSAFNIALDTTNWTKINGDVDNTKYSKIVVEVQNSFALVSIENWDV